MTYDRAKMRAELARDEGQRLKAYRDSVGKVTIGIGRNLDDVGIRPEETRRLGITKAFVLANGITPAQSSALCDADIDHAEASLDRALPWWRELDGVRQRVLLNMCFNMGIGSLTGFHNTLEMVRSGNYAGAARGMMSSKWHRQVGARAVRLEAMMASGKEPS